MDELVRRADVLKLLHEMGGCDAASDSWADGWDKAIDAAFDKVEGMKPVEPSKMEDRDAILNKLLPTLQLTRGGADVEELKGIARYDGENEVIIVYRNGYSETVCVTADSGLALIQDVVKALM